jgi:tetratricopeptide (TPR) repeat protein
MSRRIALALVGWGALTLAPFSLSSPPAAAQAPAAMPAAERAQLETERDKFSEETWRLQSEGKYAEAIVAAEQMLAVERRYLPADEVEIARSLEWLAELQEFLEDWPKAAAHRAERVEWAVNAHGADSAYVSEARRIGSRTELLRELTAEQREQWRASRLTLGRALRNFENNQGSPEELAAGIGAAEVLGGIYGQDSPHFADELTRVGEMHQWDGDHDAAVKVYQRALAIFRAALGDKHIRTATALHSLGNALEYALDFADALTAYREALAIREELLGYGDDNTVTTLNNIGVALSKSGDFTAGREIFQRVLDLRRQIWGEMHENTAHAYMNLGLFYKRIEEHDQSLPLLQRALAIRQQTHGEDHAQTADSYNTLGQLFSDMGRFQDAKRYYHQELAIRRRVQGNDHEAVASTLNDLAILVSDMGDERTARKLIEEGIAIGTKALGPEHPDVAGMLNVLAGILSDQGDFATARAHYERALAIVEKAYGPDSHELLVHLNNLGQFLKEQGDYDAARAHFERALRIVKRTFGERHGIVATLLGNIAGVLEEQGNYAEAKSYLEQSLALRRETLGNEHPDTALALYRMGYLAGEMGDAATALDIYLQVLVLYRKSLGEDHPYVARMYSNIAAIHNELENHGEARRYAQQGFDMTRRLLGDDHPETVGARRTLATVLDDAGDEEQALNYQLESLAATRKLYGDQHPDTAHAFANLGMTLMSTGDYAKVRSYLEYALAVYRKYFGEQHPSVALNLHRLGSALEFMGRPDEAAANFRQAVAISQQMMEDASVVLDEQQQILMARSLRDYLDRYLSCLLRQGNKADEAYRAVLGWKGATLVRQRAAHMAMTDEALRPTFEELQSVVRQATTLARTPGEDVDAWRVKLEALTARKKQLVEELARRSAAFRAAEATVELADIENALPADAVLVDFLIFENSGPHPQIKGTLQFHHGLVAFVVRPGRRVQMFDLGDAEEIAAAVDRWRASHGMSPDAQRAGAELRARLWQPLLAAIGDAKLALVSPDGALGKLPFSALPGARPGSYLIEDIAVVMIPVPQLLPALVADMTVEDLPTELLVLGGVIYNRGGDVPAAPVRVDALQGEDVKAEPTLPLATRPQTGLARPWDRRRVQLAQRAVVGDETWRYLPGTAVELGFIRDLYFEATGLERDSSRLVALDGVHATEEAFRAAAPQASILHLATHGFFAGADKASALDRGGSAGEMGAGELADDQPHGFSPGMLSGLVLAHANDPPQIPEDPELLAEMPDDGYLSADEIAILPLGSTQLVVLSACESGLGQTAGGEGMLGIQRAFQVAGARSTIGTLWKISDEATRKVMEEFYRFYLRGGMTPAEALRAAQLWALNNPDSIPRGADAPDDVAGATRASPYYWAAFTLSGDWR